MRRILAGLTALLVNRSHFKMFCPLFGIVVVLTLPSVCTPIDYYCPMSYGGQLNGVNYYSAMKADPRCPYEGTFLIATTQTPCDDSLAHPCSPVCYPCKVRPIPQFSDSNVVCY